MKTCIKCKQTKDLSCFNKQKQQISGLIPYYKHCYSIKQMEYRLNSPEKFKEYGKKCYDKNKESRKEKTKKILP